MKSDHLFWVVTFIWWIMNMKLSSLIWNPLLNQTWLSNLNLIFFEPVLIPNPIILEHKSIISLSQILLLDQGVDNDDLEMVFQDWSYNQDSFNVRVVHDPVHLGDNNNIDKKKAIKGGVPWWSTIFRLGNNAWPNPATTRTTTLRSHFAFPFFFFMHTCIHSNIEDNAWDRCGGRVY